MAHTARPSRGFLVSACAVLSLVLVPVPGAAQNPNPQPSGTIQAPSSPDFMLGRPRASLGLRGEWIFASAQSDIYDFITDQLTVEKSNFNTASFGGEFGMHVTDRLAVLAGVDVAKSSTPSEYRDFVDNRNLPIQQTTELSQSTFFGAIKFAVIPRGRTISRFAWIPSTIVPFIGAGGGVMSYNFRQRGDFVDFADNRVFNETFRSNGWTPTAHVFGGTDIQVYKRVYLSVEGRYVWAHAKLDSDFIDFEPMDLGGFRFGAGLHFVF